MGGGRGKSLAIWLEWFKIFVGNTTIGGEFQTLTEM